MRAHAGVLICGVLAAAVLATVAPASQAQSIALQRLCLHAFPAANQKTKGRTTSYNRQASVENVACNGFGSSVKFSINGGVVCSLLSAAIGQRYSRLALYVDGDCSAAQLAANHETGTIAAVACTMLGDLLHAIPWAKAYAAGVGIVCAFGEPLGSWIESESERVAAKGVIQSGKCLQFTTHGFPVGDTWSAVACKRRDRGFSDLPVAHHGSAAATQVVQVEPVDGSYRPLASVRVIDAGSAHCEPGSDSVGNAYRCFSGNGVYDPCWSDNAEPGVAAVVCQGRPWDTTVQRFTIPAGGLAPFYEPPASISRIEPWGIRLTSGERCLAEQGAHSGFDNGRRIVDYACERGGKYGNRVLLRGINRSGAQWKITSATYVPSRNTYQLGPVLGIATAWFAIQDGADAAAAAANTCDASALAYAALQYEQNHGSPNGPLPHITRQACAGSAAIAVFIQEAPPPGYEASIAYLASSSGWQVSGMSDFIEADQFGIPSEAYAEIMSALTGESDSESVDF